MRPDYCPIGGQPCQSMCVEPCSTKKRRITYVCPVCASSMLESDEALLRQALDRLETLAEHCEYMVGDNECRPLENANATIAALKKRVGV